MHGCGQGDYVFDDTYAITGNPDVTGADGAGWLQVMHCKRALIHTHTHTHTHTHKHTQYACMCLCVNVFPLSLCVCVFVFECVQGV